MPDIRQKERIMYFVIEALTKT